MLEGCLELVGEWVVKYEVGGAGGDGDLEDEPYTLDILISNGLVDLVTGRVGTDWIPAVSVADKNGLLGATLSILPWIPDDESCSAVCAADISEGFGGDSDRKGLVPWKLGVVASVSVATGVTMSKGLVEVRATDSVSVLAELR